MPLTYTDADIDVGDTLRTNYGDRVCERYVAEVQGDFITLKSRRVSGEPYRNHYHFVFRIRDGGIVAVKEYVDTLYVQRKLFESGEAGS